MKSEASVSSSFVRSAYRIIGLHHQIAKKFVRRVHRRKWQGKLVLSGIFAHQIQSKMKIAKQVRRQIRHRHFFSLRPFDQPASRRVLKRDLEIMLPAE